MFINQINKQDLFSCIQKLALKCEGNRLIFYNHFAIMPKKQEDQEIGILGVFKVTSSDAPHPKGKNRFLPIILKVRFEKGTQPLFLSYKVMRQQHQDMLLQYYEKKVIHHDYEDQEERNFYEGGLDYEQDHYYNTRNGDTNHRDGGMKTDEGQYFLRKKIGEHISQNTSSRRQIKLRINRDKFRQIEPSSFQNDSRPMRSCRRKGGNDPVSKNIEQQMKEQQKNVARSIADLQLEIESQFSNNENSFKKIKSRTAPIIDYDHLSEQYNRHNLISPAVIPSIKIKYEYHLAPIVTQPLRPQVNLKEINKEYSQEEFKESEESEFILDERGKEKKRREKMLREQERMNKKKKIRRIKKKLKAGRH